jgi:2-dehydro-3-deoxyphosphogluconate aldolase / (4S)-4-hydroxy-2-oxoglutarate aldolase
VPHRFFDADLRRFNADDRRFSVRSIRGFLSERNLRKSASHLQKSASKKPDRGRLKLKVQMMSLNATLRRLSYVPVIEIDDAANAVPLAEALLAGGIGCIEVTLRTDAGLDAIRAVAKSGLPMLTGVGTVTRVEQVAKCVDAGAQFAVSPGFTEALGAACVRANLPLLPGTVTPSEVMIALDAGFTVLKFFPASLYGGAAWLKAIIGPIPQATFCPTGGIQDGDIAAYLTCPNVAAFGSSAVASRVLIATKSWDEITTRAKKLMALVRAARPA